MFINTSAIASASVQNGTQPRYVLGNASPKWYTQIPNRPGLFPLFSNGCCIPGSDVLWMTLIMFTFFAAMLILCCLLSVFVRWIYKRRMRKKCEAYTEKYKEEEKYKKEMELKLKRIAMRPVHRHGAKHANAANVFEGDLANTQMASTIDQSPSRLTCTTPLQKVDSLQDAPFFNVGRGGSNPPPVVPNYFSGFTPLDSQSQSIALGPTTVMNSSHSPVSPLVVAPPIVAKGGATLDGDVTTATPIGEMPLATNGETPIGVNGGGVTTNPSDSTGSNLNSSPPTSELKKEQVSVNRDVVRAAVNLLATSRDLQPTAIPYPNVILIDADPFEHGGDVSPDSPLPFSTSSLTALSQKRSSPPLVSAEETPPKSRSSETKLSLEQSADKKSVGKLEEKKRPKFARTGVFNTPLAVESDATFPYWKDNSLLHPILEEELTNPAELPISAPSHHEMKRAEKTPSTTSSAWIHDRIYTASPQASRRSTFKSPSVSKRSSRSTVVRNAPETTSNRSPNSYELRMAADRKSKPKAEVSPPRTEKLSKRISPPTQQNSPKFSALRKAAYPKENYNADEEESE